MDGGLDVKNPHEIAEEVGRSRIEATPRTWAGLRGYITAGIEADRAQRYTEAPEQDTLERALWRVDTVLAELYDGETEEPVQALGDLMTDILHWCDYHERSLSSAQDRATQMVEWERADWGLPRIWSSDRMFRRTGPIVRQRRSERETPADRRESPNTDSRAGSGDY